MWLWAVHPCRTQEHVDELVHDEQASEEHDDWDECRWRVRWLQLWMMVVSSIVKMGGGRWIRGMVAAVAAEMEFNVCVWAK